MRLNEMWDSLTSITRHVVQLLELPSGRFGNAQGNASGHQMVEVSGGSLTATVDTSALATVAMQGGIRRTTTPTRANGSTGPAEVDDHGAVFGNLTIAHQRTLELPVAGTVASTLTNPLPEGACDGIESDSDAVVVYGMLRESPDMVHSRDPASASWTKGSGWAQVGSTTVIQHTNGGGTADLELAVHTTYPIIVGLSYVVIYTVSGRTTGTVTEKLGTGAGSARSTNATFMIAITAATNGKLIFTPTNDFDGSIDVAAIYVMPRALIPNSGVPKPQSFVRICATATKAAPTTLVASPTTQVIRAMWYRRAGAVEIS